MTENLYNALEICLQALEQGADLETCLIRFPTLADELRPILETATQARAQTIQDVPADAIRRGRARVLQYAAELREQERGKMIVPFWRKPWHIGRAIRVLATSLTTIVFLFSGGTGLVFASSTSLPGDNLYPVKRSWEGVQLALILDPKVKMEREVELEHERVNEIHDLFSESRKTRVDFQGVVELQKAKTWQIAGLQIAIDDEAVIDKTILPGSLVRVVGETEDGTIQAEQISLIQPAPASQTPSATPRPQKTLMFPPTERSSDEPTEIEKPNIETPNIETPEPQKTDSHEKESTKAPKTNDGGDSSDDGGND